MELQAVDRANIMRGFVTKKAITPRRSEAEQVVYQGTAALIQAQKDLSERRLFGPFLTEAQRYLDAVEKNAKHGRKRRHTLVMLAAAQWSFQTKSSVFSQPGTGSYGMHQRWLKDSEEYRAAHDFLIGTADNPGAVIQSRDNYLTELEYNAIQAIEKSRIVIRTAVPEAVMTLVGALNASDKRGQDWRSRIEAARTLIELAYETAGNVQDNSLQITVNNAIVQAYPEERKSLGAAAAEQPLIKEGFIDGEVTEIPANSLGKTPGKTNEPGTAEPFPPTHPTATGQKPAREGAIKEEKPEAAEALSDNSKLLAELEKIPESQRTAVLELLRTQSTLKEEEE